MCVHVLAVLPANITPETQDPKAPLWKHKPYASRLHKTATPHDKAPSSECANKPSLSQVVRWFDDPSLEAELGLHL